MKALDSLAAATTQRRAMNLARMAAMTARLDDPLFSEPSMPSATSPSTQPPTPRERAGRYDDADAARAQLPARSTHGGPYGPAVIDRVLASYGLD